MSSSGFNVSMYKQPPSGRDDLMKVVEMACDRLKLYKVLQNNPSASLEEVKLQLKDSPLRLLLEKGHRFQVEVSQKIDYDSHWILRLAYARNFFDSYFIKYELRWFKLRFDVMDDGEKASFIEENGFVLKPIQEIEKNGLKLDPQANYYKFRFHEVSSLLKLRKNPLHDGYIYLEWEDIVHWLLSRLKQNLKTSFTHLKKLLPTIQDDQLDTILSFLTLIKPTYQFVPTSSIILDQLDVKAEINFPLCMKYQHKTIRKTHHLKHFSRMQYGLFLKGIGLPLDDSLRFWMDEFIHDMPEQQFWRKYSYLFKHQYGTVGARINYIPFNCEQIIEYAVGPTQIHGCPYKHWSEEVLRRNLKDEEIPDPVIETIVSLKREEKFTEACTKYFQCVHRCSPDGLIVHPNQYYVSSCKCEEMDIEDFFSSDIDDKTD